MAQFNTGVHGNFTGRIGNVVYYLLNGKQVARIIPSKMPKATGARKRAQEDFARVMKVMQSIRDYIRIGFLDVANGSAAFQTAMSVNLHRRNADPDPTALRWLLPSQGSRATAQDAKQQRNENQLTVSWGAPTPNMPYGNRDLAMVLAINTTTLANNYNLQATRSQQQCTLSLPPATGQQEVLVFLSFYDPLSASKGKDPQNVSQAQLVEYAFSMPDE